MSIERQNLGTPASRRSRRGFSLLEVLISVALLIAIAALLWPDFTSLGVNASRNAAVDSLQAAADIARSRAMNRLEPVQLFAVEGTQAWSLDVATPPRRASPDEPEGVDSNGGLPMVRIGELPENMQIEAYAESGAEGEDSPKVEAEEFSRETAPGVAQRKRVLLALVLPDGSVEAVGAALVHRGDRSPISIQRWTGHISLGRWVSMTALPGDTESEDDSKSRSVEERTTDGDGADLGDAEGSVR